MVCDSKLKERDILELKRKGKYRVGLWLLPFSYLYQVRDSVVGESLRLLRQGYRFKDRYGAKH
jgi:hypothetical protein